MELFKNIRLKTGKAFLLKKSTKIKRKVYYLNFSKVKNIGLIWDASKPDNFASISKFYQKMHDRSVEVSVLGYFGGKNLPDQYTAVRYLTLVRRNELNVFFHPKSDEATKFLNTKFDVLIDVNFNNVFPLRYITELSNAKFKAGLYDSGERESPFDLMMEIKEPVNIDNYLNQIVEYLELINSENKNGK